jgi:predicted DsbA family dithiol-disulfide isomerase
VLTGLATECGLPREIVQRAWSDDRYAERLRQHLAAAAQYQVRATPTVFFGEQQRLDGALPQDAFLAAARAGHAAQQRAVR